MRIVHVYKDYLPVLGGIENHLRVLAEGQAQCGHDVTVLVTNPAALPPHEVLNGVRLQRASRLATVASTPLSIDLIRTLRSLQPQITHLHFPYPIGEIAQLLTGSRRPYVITYHSDVVRQQRLLAIYRPLLYRVLRNSQRIIATSRPYIDSSPYLSRFKEKCAVVPLSVDLDRFSLPASPSMPLTTSQPTLLFLGRHRYYKGVGDLLHALAMTSGCRLRIAGDGPMRSAWQQLAIQLGVGDRVEFLGDVPDEALPALFAGADIFVLPANSRAEAFGKVLLEAMAAGLPCITTELGTGTSFVVQHGVTGLVVPPEQPHALASAITALLQDETRRRQMGHNGRQRVKDNFTTERMIAAVETIYREILGTA